MTESGRRGRGIVKIGIVTSDRMTKSVVVSVERLVKHPVYKRFVKRTTRFMAHDEAQACKVGDTVEIVESRPLSARKRWRVRRIVTTGVRALEPDELRRRPARGGRRTREAAPAVEKPSAPARPRREPAGETP